LERMKMTSLILHHWILCISLEHDHRVCENISYGCTSIIFWVALTITLCKPLYDANGAFPYEFSINIKDVLKLKDVMIEHGIGPNGGLFYGMDYLENNID